MHLQVLYMEIQKTFLQTKNITKPKNIYGYSKIINEHMADYYSKKMNIPFIDLDFTVYGTWKTRYVYLKSFKLS